VGLKLDRTHELLGYADGLNIFGDKANTMKKIGKRNLR
jgi:hypothetical protein